MLALKKKREAEAAAKKLEEPVEAAPEEGGGGGGKVSLLGIGGQKKTKSADGASNTGKKRTPGEIRIQKGALIGLDWIRLQTFMVQCCSCSTQRDFHSGFACTYSGHTRVYTFST
jgi:hypothetical protein